MKSEERLANGLGLFGIGLGIVELAAPRSVAHLVGVRDRIGTRTLLRVLGMREILIGGAVLTQPETVNWLRARVGGDTMDLALLGRAFTSNAPRRGQIAAATAAVVGVTILDLRCSAQLSRPEFKSGLTQKKQPMDVTKVITVNRPAEDLYRFWRDFENLPTFMFHLESVHVTGDRRSHWKAKAPAGSAVEWDAEITEKVPNQLIAWRSLEGADVNNTGSVRFTPAPYGRGTEVRIELHYDPPAGVIGANIARLFGEEPGQQVQGDLRAFKQVMETGEVVRSEGNRGNARLMERPAQPPADEHAQ